MSTELVTTNGAALTSRSLPELEEVIERGLETFVDVGRALKEIRERDLHHEAGYKNFDTYCQERWGFTRRRAGQLIEGAVAAGRVGTIVPTLPAPANEAQARALAKAPEDVQEAVWEEVVETAPNGKVTAAHVTEVVSKRRPAQDTDEAEIKRMVKRAAKPPLPDYIVPERHEDAPRRAGIPEDVEYAATLIQKHFDERWIEALLRLLSPNKALIRVQQQQAFTAFHAAHPDVYDSLRDLALKALSLGQTPSIKLLVEQARQGGVSIRNEFASHYARLLMDREPKLVGFFAGRGKEPTDG